jgi:catechol 2,3-dioxygenase-like lactoylglutathione lyase family enzyme
MAGIQIRRVNHVALPIVDRRKSLPFYRDLLGLKVIPSMVDSPGVTWLQIADGAMIHPVEPRTDGTPPSWHVAFEVVDFDETLKALTEAGFKIDSQGVRHDGQQFLFVVDPDGNRIEFATLGGPPPANRVCDADGHTTVV